jgi:transposase-like protein
MSSTPKNTLEFNGIIDLMDRIPDDSAALEYFKTIRWAGKVYCPYCQSESVITRKNGKSYDCRGCKVHFTDKSGTIFADTKVGMRKWIMAMYLLTSNKKGLSSYDLSRKIKVTQKTAWMMLSKIQTAFINGGFDTKATDTVQLDESYVGGKEANKHWDKRTAGAEGRSTKVKTAVLGIHSEEHGIYAVTIPNAKQTTILPIIESNVAKGATVMTDEFKAYSPLSKTYNHFVVNHGGGEFATGINNEVTVNQVENFWSHFKRMFHGTHHHLSRKHMDKYLAAESFRYNERGLQEWERLAVAVGKAAHTYVTCTQITQLPDGRQEEAAEV